MYLRKNASNLAMWTDKVWICNIPIALLKLDYTNMLVKMSEMFILGLKNSGLFSSL